jgi:hypothetical protein
MFVPGKLINLTFGKLIRDIGITHGNESKVGHYVGVMVRRLTLCNPPYTHNYDP